MFCKWERRGMVGIWVQVETWRELVPVCVWPKQGSETREISVAQVGFYCSGRKYKYTKYTNTQIHKIHKYTNKDTRLGYWFSLLTPEGRLDVGRRRCKKTGSKKFTAIERLVQRKANHHHQRKKERVQIIRCNSTFRPKPVHTVIAFAALSSLLPIISNVLKVLCTSLNPPRDPIPSHPIQPSCSTMVLHISMTIDGFLKLKSWFSFRTEIVQWCLQA